MSVYPNQQQQETIIVQQQPQAIVIVGGPGQTSREWTTGLCGCFEDCCSCLFAYFCYPCFMCTLAGRMDECACGPFCLGSTFTVAMRTKLRMTHKIRGSILNDVCCVCWCPCCTAMQMYRELDNVGRGVI